MIRFWKLSARADNPKAGELTLYGEISGETWYGDEITPKQFKQDLDALGEIETLDIFINSPGGDVFAAMSIYNTIKRCPATVTATIDGIAASAASIICMAADKIIMPRNAEMMIHNASILARGNKNDLRTLADELERIDGQLADIYADRCGMTRDEVAVMLDAETWMTGEEALKAGFCDEVEENKRIAACADADKFFAWYKHPPKQPTTEKAPKTANDGGFSIRQDGTTVLFGTVISQGKIQQPDNGGESQPAADICLEAQKRRFTLNDKKRILLEE